MKYVLLIFAFVFGDCFADSAWPHGKAEYLYEIENYKPLKRVTAPYPKKAKKKKLEGSVLLEFSVNEKGRVFSISVAESTHKIFEKVAIKALGKVRFFPPSRKGLKAPLKNLRARYVFKLEGT